MVKSILLKAFFTIGLSFAIFQLISKPGEVSASSELSASGQVADLKDQLEKGLRIRRENEFQFVGRVVDLVNQGQLPQKLVVETFEYARRKHRKYPYPYFERALRLRAAKIGVAI